MDSWFSSLITSWYKLNKRDLPWRHTQDPYLIWLSEIILQQTQVQQGLAYYLKFSSAYPDVRLLAQATEDEVLRHWQGLGYYSRARNMLTAAKQIVDKHNGKFPSTFEEIKQLKGVGDYSAAAISSFAFELPHAVIDGNVYRVLSRVFGISTPIDTSAGKKEFSFLANSLLDKKNAALHNQAIMEFGSQLCRPANPGCDICVLRHKCAAYKNGTIKALPVKAKKIKVKERFFNYIIIADRNGEILLNRREQKDIWNGLYEFNLIETDAKVPSPDLLKTEQFKKWCADDVVVRHVSEDYKHILTHQHLHAKFCVVTTKGAFRKTQIKATAGKLKDYAFPQLIGKFLNDCDLKEIV